ncbi:hypothetical protein OV450_1403 [Actinobacteria bacterium OV450]|nr:hypothetical protein OV450_1403 [Actinobacteria bacterium OV450]
MTDTSPAASTYRAARESARTAASAAAHAAAAYLIQANGGSGTITKPYGPGGGIRSWCAMAAPGVSAHILAGSFGDEAYLSFNVLEPAKYERISAWFQNRSDCPHDEECDCEAEPWPTAASLADGFEQDVCFLDGELRGCVHQEHGRVALTLFGETVETVADLLRALRTD